MESKKDINAENLQEKRRTPSDELYGKEVGGENGVSGSSEEKPEDGAGDFGSAARRPGPEANVDKEKP